MPPFDPTRTPVLLGRDKPLKDPQVAEKAILNALRAMVRQSQALAEADYTCSMTIRQARIILKRKPEEFALLLEVPLDTIERWESRNSPDQVAKTMAYTAKVIDETYRLLSFSQGGADSRAELTLGDCLKYLSADQFETFIQWVEQGKERAVKPTEPQMLPQ